MRRRGAATVLLLCLAVVPLGCAGIPDEGPLVEGGATELPDAAAPFDFSPPGPAPGATPEQVVAGFLTALQATPLTTTVAGQYLAEGAVDGWHPERRTVLYAEQDVQGSPVAPGGAPVTVPVSLRQVFALDATGRWAGRQRRLESEGLRLTVVREGGEWRVDDPPDALVLPLTHFENRYRRFAVYFADPSGSILVPEPVYQPAEVQTSTQLVNALLAGPQGTEQAGDRTYLPPRTQLVVSVPVGDDGVARVPLTGDILDLPPRDLQVAAAQVAWTLRQVPDVRAFRLTADGEPVSVPGIGQLVPVDALPQYSPLVASASSDLFGVRSTYVRRVSEGRETAFLDLPEDLRATALGVSLDGDRVAVTDPRGRAHVLVPRNTQRGTVTRAEDVDGPPATRPLWDWADALWLVPRRFDGRVRVLVGGRLRSLRWDAPAAVGRRVRAAAMSRDGSRLVAAVDGADGTDRLLLARVLRSPDRAGRPLALRPAGVVGTGRPLPPVLEIGWRDPLTLAVLVRTGRLSSRVLAVPVDGQRESRVLSQDSDMLFGRAVAMAASPSSEEVRVTTADGDLHVLTEPGRWRLEAQDSRPLRVPAFVG